MHLDNLLEHLNPYGPYQILTWLVLSLFTCFPPAWHQFAITFTAFFPTDYGCRNMNWTDVTTSNNGKVSYPMTVRSPIPGQQCLATLYRYSSNDTRRAKLLSATNETCSSDFWYSENDPVTLTLVTQWDLVCSRENLLIFINAAEGTGEVIGCVIFGYLADRLGRKVSYFTSAALLFASGLLCAFAPHPIVAIIARLAIGISLTGLNNIGFLMNAELFTPNARTIFSTGGELMWALAVVSLAGVGYLIRDSFWLMMAITLPLVLMTPFWWFINESLHWHISKGHLEEAKACLRKVARFNKVKLDEELVQQVLEEDIERERELIHSKKSLASSRNSNNHSSLRRTASSFKSSGVNGSNGSNVNGDHSLTTLNAQQPNDKMLHSQQQQHLLLPPPSPLPSSGLDAESTLTPAVISDQVINRHVKTSLPSSPFSSRLSPLHRSSSSVSTIGNAEGGVLNLFRTPRLRLITIFLTLLWFANTMCYYGLQQGVDFYLSFFILAVVEVPSIFVCIPLMMWLGRRWSIIAFQILAGISCAVVPFIPPGHEIITISVAAFGKFAVCSSFTVLYVYAVELFPTILRGTGFGVVSVIGRVGMIVAPVINSLGYGETSSSVPAWVRMVIYGTVMIATGFLTLPLPETNRQPLADTVEEMENYAQYCRDYHKARSADLGEESSNNDAAKNSRKCSCINFKS